MAGKVSDIKKRVRGSIFLPNQPAPGSAGARVRSGIFPNVLETVLVSGPANNSVVKDTRVDFVLDGWQVLPFKKTSRFEVWLSGVDAGWRETYDHATYNLPPGPKDYIFLARAKNDLGEVDATPLVINFSVAISPYFGQFDISNVNKQGTSDKPQYEKITLYSRNDSPVNITGWRVAVKRSGFSFVIPTAARIYDPRDFLGNDQIVLNKSGYLDIFVGKRSPVGVNFQENSCQGYLSDGFESYDYLSGYSCTLPDPSSYSNFSLSCRNYLRGIGSCRNVDLLYYQFTTDPECRDFVVRNYNYQACVARSKNRAEFYAGRWRIYLGRTDEILDDLNDTIYLYDSRGLLAASYSY